jgi:hypothetical protein
MEIIATPTEFIQGRTDILTIAGVVLGIVVVVYLYRKVKWLIDSDARNAYYDQQNR